MKPLEKKPMNGFGGHRQCENWTTEERVPVTRWEDDKEIVTKTVKTVHRITVQSSDSPWPAFRVWGTVTIYHEEEFYHEEELEGFPEWAVAYIPDNPRVNYNRFESVAAAKAAVENEITRMITEIEITRMITEIKEWLLKEWLDEE